MCNNYRQVRIDYYLLSVIWPRTVAAVTCCIGIRTIFCTAKYNMHELQPSLDPKTAVAHGLSPTLLPPCCPSFVFGLVMSLEYYYRITKLSLGIGINRRFRPRTRDRLFCDMSSVVFGILESNSSPNDIERKRAWCCVRPTYQDGYTEN
jgi:hypothetical protein